MNGLIRAMGVVALVATAPAWAQKPPDINAGELALLPKYCPDTQTMAEVDPRTSEQGRYWLGLLGPGFWGLHHYCWGLIHVHRAGMAGVDPMKRRWHLETAINDYRYVLQNAPSDFVLAPEILLRVGEAYVELKAPSAALEAFARSRERKRDYWPAYARAASVLQGLGRQDAALDLLAQGLAAIPGEPTLAEAYRRGGGDAKRLEAARAAAASAAEDSSPK